MAMLKNRSKSKRKSLIRYGVTLVLFLVIFCAGSPSVAHATGNRSNEGTSGNESLVNDDGFNFNITSNAGSANLESTLQILIILTILSLAPSILIMVTSFTRIIVVFHFVRTAIGTQTAPPNQVLVGLSLFITLAIMSPVMMQINDDAVQPFMNGRIQQETALERGIAPLREFMLKETRDKDLKLFAIEECGVDGRSFPKSSAVLTRRMNENKSNLEDLGIYFDTPRGKNRRIRIWRQ